MISKNEGIIIFIKKIRDNDLYIRVLCSEDELLSGLVYGGNSSKKKLTYQLGYFIEYSLLKKNINIVPSFDASIIKPYISSIINDQFKSLSLLCIISLINSSIIEGQKLNSLYKSIKDIIEIISFKNNWISFFCEWLLTLLKIIGYQVDYKNKKEYKYFDKITHEFNNFNNNNSIIFPHLFLKHTLKSNLSDVTNIFNIFESIYTKNHLDNINYKMPINFINFKNKVINKLQEIK